MTMDEIERYRDPGERLPALIDYLKNDQVERAVRSGQPIVNITINEAPRPVAAEPKQDVATKYAGHMILATWSLIVLAGVAVVFVMIAGALMTMMISLAVCVIAIATAVGFLRRSKGESQAMEDARAYVRTRKG